MTTTPRAAAVTQPPRALRSPAMGPASDDERPANNVIVVGIASSQATCAAGRKVLTLADAAAGRSNLSYVVDALSADLRLSSAAYGLGAGLFFISYTSVELPSNLLLHVFGGRAWLSRILIAWGLVASCGAAVNNAAGFYAWRLALGAAEAGFFPGAGPSPLPARCAADGQCGLFVRRLSRASLGSRGARYGEPWQCERHDCGPRAYPRALHRVPQTCTWAISSMAPPSHTHEPCSWLAQPAPASWAAGRRLP